MSVTSLLRSNERAAIGQLKGVLLREIGLDRLILYGSKARGDSDASSDIDLLVLLDHRPDWRKKREIYYRCFRIGLEHDVVIQPVIFAADDFRSPRFAVTPLVRNVTTEGITV
jgi:predicted nucleotidyltransferase